MAKKRFYSNGKLLLSGEYAVLDGALALALPSKRGQSLEVRSPEANKISWKSLDHLGTQWFETTIAPHEIESPSASGEGDIRQRLLNILSHARALNSSFLTDHSGCEVITTLEFPREWGLGSSSTLINNIAQWAQIDPYELLERTFSGSGYDIACAMNNFPLLYQKTATGPTVSKVKLNYSFSEQLFFIYLNKKQNSRRSIASYNRKKLNTSDFVKAINSLTLAFSECRELHEFTSLVEAHEKLVSSAIGIPPIRESHFSDFKGSVKSLGGWGGDFILVVTPKEGLSYFKSKGYHTIIPFGEMVRS